MTKSSGPRTELSGTPQKDVYQEDRSVSHLIQKQPYYRILWTGSCAWTSDSEAGVKTEKSGVAGRDGECGDDVVGLLVKERRGLDILPVKKEAKLSASEVPGKVVGSGEEDLRCRSLLTICQRRLELSEDEDTRLE